MNRKVFLYETKTGRCPAKEFIKSLKPKEQQKMVWGLKLLEDGFPLKEPYFKKIINTENLWELRLTFGGNTFRLFFFEWDDTTVIVSSGYQKKNKKEQQKAIEIAKMYQLDYKERNNENT